MSDMSLRKPSQNYGPLQEGKTGVGALKARIWAWMLNMPHSPPKEGAKALRQSTPVAKPVTAACDHDRACGRGFSCDRHFGLCVPLRGEGHYCRRDAQCVRGLSCMFGKCHRSIPDGQEGARCKVDRDCGASMCCARHHGEQVCKRRLTLDESCYVPDGGLAFSINQICPCDEGLLCRESSGKLQREREFIYQPERTSWTCQVPNL
ncbi:dickkopf-related protein 3-like [Simochromis diagramma]|uniref:dickkopf-related protein 3-like n=1 Tax=Simochromis diagramma TaxID=43689 RepID=UPI001A7E8C86|nr:dickkopf-related protein 3-like [Simochromis diagramma]